MRRQETLGNLLSATLALCAVAVSVVAVHREFWGQPAVSAVGYAHHKIKNAAEFGRIGHVLGATGARIKVVEFSDFQCPFCRGLSTTVDSLLSRHASTVAVVYRNFPLSIHPAAMPAAIAAECAGDQGKFAEYANLLFRLQDSVASLSWTILAERAGLADTSLFNKCIASPEPRTRISRDVAAARSLGITGTPSLIIGDELYGGAAPLDSIESWIAQSDKTFAHDLASSRAGSQ